MIINFNVQVFLELVERMFVLFSVFFFFSNCITLPDFAKATLILILQRKTNLMDRNVHCTYLQPHWLPPVLGVRTDLLQLQCESVWSILTACPSPWVKGQRPTGQQQPGRKRRQRCEYHQIIAKVHVHSLSWIANMFPSAKKRLCWLLSCLRYTR